MRSHHRIPPAGHEPGADLRQEQHADYRLFELGGSHYEIGYAIGKATPLRVVERRRDAAADQAFSTACAEVVAHYHPGLLDEFRGYAEAQARPWEDVAAHLSLNLPEGVLSGCTTAAWRLPDGHVLIARNYDFLYTQQQRYLRRLAPQGYIPTLGTQAGLLGSCYDGVNSHGLFVALHLVHAQIAPRVLPGVPYHLIPRLVLETCRTAREAAGLVAALPHLFPFNYLIADADDMFALEAYPGLTRLRRAEGEHLVVTNHFVQPELRALQGRRQLKDQLERVGWIERHFIEDGVRDAATGWEWACDMLRDHHTPMCHHRPTQATLWSLVADLATHRIAYCQGAPCRNEFVEYEWPSEMPAGAPCVQAIRQGWSPT